MTKLGKMKIIYYLFQSFVIVNKEQVGVLIDILPLVCIIATLINLLPVQQKSRRYKSPAFFMLLVTKRKSIA